MDKTVLKFNLASIIGDYRIACCLAFRHPSLRHPTHDASDVIRSLQSLGKDTKKVIMVETPDIPNLGDHAITFAQRQFMKKYHDLPVVCVESDQTYAVLPGIKKFTTDQDLVLINGGGSMGDLYMPNEERKCAWIDTFRHNRVIYCPQTITYSNSSYAIKLLHHTQALYRSVPDLHLFAREMNSYRLMKQWYPDSDVHATPDIVLSLSGFDKNPDMNNRSGILLCLRDDKEKVTSDDASAFILKSAQQTGETVRNTDTVVRGWEGVMSLPDGDREIQKKFDEFRKAKLVITDRIHGMLFATVTGTPCIAMNNSNGKVGFEYEWIKDLPYTRFATAPSQIPAYIDELLTLQQTHFPNDVFETKFASLRHLITD